MKSDYAFNWRIPHLDQKHCSRQIEKFIIQHIESKDLRPGDVLPGYRQVAEINGVSLNSVRCAYARLIGAFWLDAKNGSGTFVSSRLPIEKITGAKDTFEEELADGLDFLPLAAAQQRNFTQPFVIIGTDFPSPALFPEDKFSKYCNKHRINSAGLSQAELLTAYDGQYLKNAIIIDLNQYRGFNLKPEQLHLITGREESLKSVFGVLLVKRAELVINTAPYDPVVDRVLREHQAVILSLKAGEPDFISNVEQVLSQMKVKAIYIRPACSYPDSNTLAPAVCEELVVLARKYKVFIVEEDPEHEFWLGIQPYTPLARYDHGGLVIYLAPLSKANADLKAIRVLVASARIIRMLQSATVLETENRNIIKEKGIADLILKGDLEEFRRNARIAARRNREILNLILKNYLSAYLTYTLPEHGLTFWIHFADRFDLNLALKEMVKLGLEVPYHPNSRPGIEKINDMMLGFGAFDIAEAEGGAKLLSEILKQLDGG